MNEKQMGGSLTEARKLLRRAGIPPERVMIEGLTAQGYYEVKLDSNGRKVRDSTGNPITIWRTWPEKFDLVEFFGSLPYWG